jgi:hypothetical protein
MQNIFIGFIISMMTVFTVCAQDNGTNIQQKGNDMKIKIVIGGKVFIAVLYDNKTAKDLILKLPLAINMNELNGNEKYYNFPQKISAGLAECPRTINTGDIMIWSSNCLVLFYKTFSTSYNYIKIGRIENTNGLEAALGKGNVDVTFTKDYYADSPRR